MRYPTLQRPGRLQNVAAKESARAASATVDKDSVKITQALSASRLHPIMDSAAWQSSRTQSEIINKSIQLLD